LHTGYLPNQPEALQLAFQNFIAKKKAELWTKWETSCSYCGCEPEAMGQKQFDKLSDKLAQLSRLTTLGAEKPQPK
jgi:hypothetical protein